MYRIIYSYIQIPIEYLISITTVVTSVMKMIVMFRDEAKSVLVQQKSISSFTYSYGLVYNR